MTVPGHIKGISATDRKRAKDRIHRNANSKRRALSGPTPPMGRKPSHLLLILVFMVMLGAIFVSRIPEAPSTRTLRLPEDLAESELRVLRVALEHFKQDCERYPTTDEGITVLITNPGETNWHGPYVTMTQHDPWERQYIYHQEAGKVVILSAGPDGIKGSDDDLFPFDWTNHAGVHRAGGSTRAPSSDARAWLRISPANPIDL